MGGEAGVHEETFFAIPFFETAVVEQFQIVLDNKGDNIVLEAFLKEDQAAYTAISVLEGMDALKGHMEGYDVLKGLRKKSIIVCQQLADLIGNILRQRGVIAAHLVGKFLVPPYCKPILAAIAGTSLQHKMQFFDKLPFIFN